MSEFNRRMKAEIEHARISLQEDLDEIGIVGNGFWEEHERIENKIVDDMQKEFPKFEYTDYAPEGGQGEIIGYDTIDVDEVKRWFIKWFGDK